jgi:hypothetical protein
MRKNNSTTPTQVKGGYLGAGSNFESVGVFVFIKNEYLQSNTFAA